jgi:hypothetical protein
MRSQLLKCLKESGEPLPGATFLITLAEAPEERPPYEVKHAQTISARSVRGYQARLRANLREQTEADLRLCSLYGGAE